MGKISKLPCVLEKTSTMKLELHLILKCMSLQSVPWHFPEDIHFISVLLVQLPMPLHCLI